MQTPFFSFLEFPRIFGHPPGLTYLLKFFLEIFGISFFSIRLCQCFIFFVFLRFWYLCLYLKTQNRTQSFLLLSLFAASPLIFIASFDFFYEIPALMLFTMSYYFYKREKLIASTIFAILCSFTLESYLAWPLAVIILSSQKKTRLVFSLPILLYGLYLLYFWLIGSDILTNYTFTSLESRQFNILQHILATNRIRPMVWRDLIHFLFFGFSLIFVMKKCRLHVRVLFDTNKELVLCCTILFFFFLLVAAPTVSRDFLYLVFFASVVTATALREIKRKEIFMNTVLLLFILNLFNFYNAQLSIGPNSKEYFWRFKGLYTHLERVNAILERKEGLIFKSNSLLQKIFADPIMGLARVKRKVTSQQDFNVFIFSPGIFTENFGAKEVERIRYKFKDTKYVNTAYFETEINFK